MSKQKFYNWGGLFNKKRFEWITKEKVKSLRNLTIEKSVLMLESLTLPETLNEFKKQPFIHTPLCLKVGLKVRRDDFTSRNI